MITAPPLVRRFFELAPSSDTEAYLALYADDALVEDEGKELVGIDAIRAWHAEVPQVEYEITDVDAAGDGVVVTVTITGDFPGSPFAGLHFRFEDLDDEHVKVLRIRP